MPHPQRIISVNLQRKGEMGLEAEITLPEGISGWFIWHDKKIEIKAGKQTLIYNGGLWK